MAARLKIEKKGGWNLKIFTFWKYWANLSQTWLKWSLGGPLLKLCPVTPTSKQNGRQGINRKKGGWISKIFSYETAVEILTKLCRNVKQVVLYQICVFCTDRKFKMAAMAKLSLTLNPMGISHFHLLLWNNCRDFNQTLQKCWSVDPLSDLCFLCRLEIQNGRHDKT